MIIPQCVRECLQIVVDEKIVSAHYLYTMASAYGSQWHAMLTELLSYVQEQTSPHSPVRTAFVNSANRLHEELKG